ncbi:MAG TPA: 3-hydroxyacyl-CoA dehydrogenase family protein [bacterium]|nr:MAG: 3-hydroxyadipyl-CoA dehydrogenase [bacterium ADurb.Bin236]HOY61753.1 3-hydroxyacyl-CoA dehydrogenase family protein [bacterium]HPI77021.1 3-hydroxyacyl-CoA dehydrogenase family protein [bacterium]HPN93406.1 3-hydroxyacyl-CoA dehydrogenase family protein [bacterium]
MENRELVLNRIFAAVVAEAERAAAEGVASPQEIDDAMRMGALFKKTPFAYTAEVGEETMRARLDEFAAKYGDRFKV